MLAARLRLPSTGSPRDAGLRSASFISTQTHALIAYEERADVYLFFVFPYVDVVWYWRLHFLVFTSPIRSCKVMLGLVQNAKANAVRASLNTDQMVLSHVQVCNPCAISARSFVALHACCIIPAFVSIWPFSNVGFRAFFIYLGYEVPSLHADCFRYRCSYPAFSRSTQLPIHSSACLIILLLPPLFLHFYFPSHHTCIALQLRMPYVLTRPFLPRSTLPAPPAAALTVPTVASTPTCARPPTSRSSPLKRPSKCPRPLAARARPLLVWARVPPLRLTLLCMNWVVFLKRYK